MKPEHAVLFQSLRIKSLTLRNRIVAPPMVQLRPIVSREGIGWYRRLAAGGAGLVIVEATGVPLFGLELTVQDLRPLAQAIRGEGAAAAIQLFPVRFGIDAAPDEFSTQEIRSIVEAYGNAALICRDAGFDGVEPHGAHGFVLNAFFMPDRNHRTDEYGGSFENRCRFAVDIVHRIREATGDSLRILYRHTPMCGSYSIAESLALAENLVRAGVDVLDISPSRKDTVADMAAPFKKHVQAPVIAVSGMNDADAAAGALRQVRCDLVAIGRGLIADARWPAKVLAGHPEDIRRCTECEAGCSLDRGTPVDCTLWDHDEVADFM